MDTNKPDADVISNEIATLFPMELAKKLYIEFDEKWSREHADEVLFPEITPEFEQGLQEEIKECDDSSEKEGCQNLLEGIKQFSGSTVAELGLKPDDEEIEFVVNGLCLMAISHWRSILYIVNSAINGAVVLNDMLVPVEEKISVFHKGLAELFANWDEALDASYYHVFGNNSEQGKQLAIAFATNLRAEIDRTGKLRVIENLVINKCGSRYILEKEL